ncbi:nucleotidyltransferase domain-containing protein [Paenalcaligenes suwonensis]|uniref:nucleotidyltransferase domain-containing protein n=1 Tax=Paenalcaligenes suwonensis TaxID=1202713 RepID=UPI001408DD45|nr:nucleotidyltransferase domain-containing protein [Paenalcaligenes suwonensis]NHC61687.1 nucleotidyltransferase domain-containing protein [Paenalcaligenes suwonensis]
MSSPTQSHVSSTLPCLDYTPLQAEFQPVVDEVSHAVARIVGDNLDSLYLYGSVAKGMAKVGVSDVDICLITTHPLSAAQNEQLATLCENTAARHFSVSKIDIDCGTREQVLATQNHYSWGYWIKHHCRCIQGEDLAQHFQPFAPSRDIALAVNGDYHGVLQGYLLRLQETASEHHLRRLQKEASRKLIRATNILRPASSTYWPATLAEHVSFAAQHSPGSVEFLPFFLLQAHTPTAPIPEFCERLQQALQWMQQQGDY